MVSRRSARSAEKPNPAWIPRPNSPLEKTHHNTRVVSVALVAALVALLEMPPEHGGPADLDRGHHAALRDGHGSTMLLPVGWTVAAEYVRYFKLRAIHRLSSEGLGCIWLRLSGDWPREQIEGTGGRAHLGGGDPQIPRGGRQAAMTQQQLDGAHVGAGLQQMDGEGVAAMPHAA